MRPILRLLIASLMISTSCTNLQKENEKASVHSFGAKNFSLQNLDSFSLLTVHNPWQNASNSEFRYILKSENQAIPDSLLIYPVINVPVQRAIVFSTTHIGFLSEIGARNIICGVSGKNYVNDSVVSAGINLGIVSDVGFPPNIDYETIIRLQPDVVFLYGLESSVTGIVKRLDQAGIPCVLIAEYLEPHPLGKMEWLKVMAAFTGKQVLADSIILNRTKEYLHCSALVKSTHSKPKVLVGLPWKDSWNMAGGKSFTAKLIEDAGGDFLWKDNNSTEYLPLNLESVFIKALKADVWINTGTASVLQEITGYDPRFADIAAFRSGQVFNNNARLNKTGGNDFWESGASRPDVVLKDLIKIFHPELLKEHSFVYYRQLE